jgi:hypothetical protein
VGARAVAWLAGGVAWLAGGVAWLAGGVAWLAGGVAWLAGGVAWLAGERSHGPVRGQREPPPMYIAVNRTRRSWL